jgi:5-methyltetrahydropteroyltriglutamate--homocysteine methyltransferase
MDADEDEVAQSSIRAIVGGKLLPTMVVGSHGTPSWFLSARKDAMAGEYGPLDLGEMYDDAVRIALLDQEEAGVDIVSDGELRREDFILGFYQYLTPLEPIPPARRLGQSGYDQITTYRALDRISAPRGLGAVAEYRFASRIARRPLKVALPGPLTLCTAIQPSGAYPEVADLARDLARIVNAELKALIAAGARLLQLDEPGFFRFLPTPEAKAAIFNETIAGVEATLCLHICFGNYRKQNSNFRRYSRVFPGILVAEADCFLLEFANRELAELDQWPVWEREWRETANSTRLRELAVGVIDVKSFHVETPEEVAWRIRQALRFVDPEQLIVTADCGFSQTARWVAAAKLKAMVEGAALVRRELGE